MEPENRGKLHALAANGPVTAVVPKRWRERALGRRWSHDGPHTDRALQIVPVTWLGPAHPSLGLMRVPSRLVPAEAVVQIEEEPWTPTAFALARRGLGAGTVLFTWENLDRRLPPPWRAVRRRVFARLSGLIAGSRRAAEIARRQGYRGPIAVIPQLGVDLPPDPGPRVPGPVLRIAFVGRLVTAKGVDVLLRAVAALDAPWRLTVVGDGPDRPALERLAASLGLGRRVAFAGARPHDAVATLWADTDVLVLPSRATPTWAEQFGHVLLEAMAHRVVVVGSTCGAIPEVIGDAGLIFPDGEVAALTAVLERLAASRALSDQLGALGWRRVAAQFTNDRIADRTRAFHAEVFSNR